MSSYGTILSDRYYDNKIEIECIKKNTILFVIMRITYETDSIRYENKRVPESTGNEGSWTEGANLELGQGVLLLLFA